MSLFQKPFERRVVFTKAKNWLRADAHKNYGHIGQRIIFSLIGTKGAISWTLYPYWYIESSRLAFTQGSSAYSLKYRPETWSLDYHAYEAQYERQTCLTCDLLDGGKCYSDGTSLGAKDLLEPFLAGGTDWLWPHLEKIYAARFLGAEWPEPVVTYEPHPDDVKEPK